MRRDVWSAVVVREEDLRVGRRAESGKTGHETEPRRGLGVVATQAERNAAGDGLLMMPTTREEKPSQFRSRPNTSIKHRLGSDRAQG